MIEKLYSPLPRETQTMRLIELEPGIWEQEIQCRLVETTIESARGSYTTISYTWGNANIVKPMLITCNSQGVPISENLFTLLRRLRRAHDSVRLWADALCIDQTNPSERTHQVKLMGEIYKNSKHTVIWLGERTQHDDLGEKYFHVLASTDEDGSFGDTLYISWHNDERDRLKSDTYLMDFRQYQDKMFKWEKGLRHQPRDRCPPPETNKPRNDIFGAFCLISHLARGSQARDVPYLYETSMLYSRDEAARCSRVLNGLERIMSRSWWTRIWVIQETVLSKDATVRYGTMSAPWSMFAAAAAHYEQERHRLCLDLSGDMPGYVQLNYFSNRVLEIDNARLDYRANVNVTLLSLLRKFRSRQASDERDKVFALLGLATNWQSLPPITPDYNLDIAEIFHKTTVSMMLGSRSPSTLAGDLQRRKMKTGPSWVMDWSLPSRPLEIERINSLRMYNACSHNIGHVRLHSQAILEVESICFDEAVDVGDVILHTQINDTMATIRSWSFLAGLPKSSDRPYPSGGTCSDAFWRTLCGDMVHTDHPGDINTTDRRNSYRRATSDDFEAYDAWRMWSRCISRDTRTRTIAFTQRDLDEGISSIHYALKTTTSHRRFFITRKGYMGIGPSSTAIGDQICVLMGSKVPFLLRPAKARSCWGKPVQNLVHPTKQQPTLNAGRCTTAKHICHSLIGDCLVYGLMDGEALLDRSKSVQPVFIT